MSFKTKRQLTTKKRSKTELPPAPMLRTAGASLKPKKSMALRTRDPKPQPVARKNADKYGHLSREELIALLERRDAARQYGLIWERDELELERSLNDDFVVLDLDRNLSKGLPPYQNLLIEGDNFDALRYLNIAYRGQVKCIYIDPPFNIGRRDFVYNDRYVDEDDAFLHSKWLEYMYRRLMLARDLLADDGVIFASIGESEYANLSLLMDRVFPKMKVSTFVWRRRSGANDSKDRFISLDHEYVLCYANKSFSFGGISKAGSYENADNDERGDWVDGPLNQGKDLKQRPDAYYPIYNPQADIWYACDPDSVWRFASENRLRPGQKLRTVTMEKLVETNLVKWPSEQKSVTYGSLDELLDAITAGTAPRNLRIYENLGSLFEAIDRGQAPARLRDFIEPLEFWVGKRIGIGKPRLKRLVTEIKRQEKPISTWILPSAIKRADMDEINVEEIEYFQVGSTSEGTTLLAQMVGNKDFPYPKPLSLLKELISQSTDADSGHIVLDFFAGSGTTGHAVMALNAQDNGNRSFILISSTEATSQDKSKNVCRDITAKRLAAAIDGYSYRNSRGTVTVEGLGGEFAYMSSTRIAREALALDIRHDQIWFALQQMHANVVSPFDENATIQVLLSEEGADMIYLTRVDNTAIEALSNRFEKISKTVIIYSWQPGLVKQRISDPRARVRKVPEYIVERFGGSKA